MKKPINEDPLAYYYTREKEGYGWVRGRLIGLGEEGSQLIGGELPPGAFLDFANLPREAEHVRRFANQYGDLFGQYSPEAWVIGRGVAKGGSTLAAWVAEIADMQALVSIWHATQDRKRRGELQKIITWKGDDVWYSIATPRRAMPLGRFASHHFAKGEILMPARHALQKEINRRLSDPEMSATPRLVWTQQYDKDYAHWPAKDWEMRIVVTPTNLLAALWVQFAQAIARNYQLRPCKVDGRLFIVGPGGKRTDAETCSGTCRQRWHAHK